MTLHRRRVMGPTGRHNEQPPAPRQSVPGELLFEFYVERTKRFYRCELRDHGPEYGVEAQFLDPVDLVFARRFDPRLDPSRTPRAMAIAWAQAERAALENGGA